MPVLVSNTDVVNALVRKGPWGTYAHKDQQTSVIKKKNGNRHKGEEFFIDEKRPSRVNDAVVALGWDILCRVLATEVFCVNREVRAAAVFGGKITCDTDTWDINLGFYITKKA